MPILIEFCVQTELSHTLKVLMYAPGTNAAESQLISILQSLKLAHYSGDCNPSDTECWHLLPMISFNEQQPRLEANTTDLTTSSLGAKLIDALQRTRALLSENKAIYQNNESVLFLGMDSPDIPIEEVIYGLQISSKQKMQHNNEFEAQMQTRGKAHLCPANDGGYGLLSLPIHAPSHIFSGIRWSNRLTAVSQLKALTDAGIDVSLGQLMFDIDEAEDVYQLAERLVEGHSLDTLKKEDVLTKFASGIRVPDDKINARRGCPHTLQAMIDLGVIK
jgi:glycosyltransferase A (GT-A) superfamily protein (DUF2064 family)